MQDSVLVAILAGGQGTRIRELAPSLPKSLIEVDGRALIFRQIDQFLAKQFNDICVIGGYKGTQLRNAIEQEYGNKINVLIEDIPLGTGGCLSLLKHFRNSTYIVISSDLLFSFDFLKLINYHFITKSDLTLTVQPNSHPKDSDLVEVDGEDCVLKLHNRPHPVDFRYQNLANASIAVISRKIVEQIKPNVFLNFEKDIVVNSLNKNFRVMGYRTSEYIEDVGTPDRFEKVRKDLEKNIHNARSLHNKQKALFFNRDNLFIEFRKAENLGEIYKIFEKTNASSYLSIGLSTRFFIKDRRVLTLEESLEFSKEIDTQLGNQGLKIDDTFVCHHSLSQDFFKASLDLCDCRKEKSFLIARCIQKYSVDISKSFMLSFTRDDVEMASELGLRSVFLEDKNYLETITNKLKE